MPSTKPVALQRCVADVVKSGKSTDSAFAICTASLQKAGLLKSGSQEPTAKGKKRDKELSNKPDNDGKLADYEKVVKAAKESAEYERAKVGALAWASSVLQ